MAFLSKKIQKPSLVEILELLAARLAALFAQEVGLGSSIFEGDFETIINSLRKVGHLVKDILCVFRKFSSKFIRLSYS